MAAFFPFSSLPKVSGSTIADPANITAGSTGVTTLTIPGFAPGMIPLVDAPNLEAGLIITGARCTAANTVVVSIYNSTGGAINPAPQRFNAVAL